MIFYLTWFLCGFYPFSPLTDRKIIKIVQLYGNLYIKYGLGPVFWPGVTQLRPNILFLSIDMSSNMGFEWFLSIFTFYRSKKYQNDPILWQFVPKIRPGARFLTRGHSTKTQILFVIIDMLSNVVAEWFLSNFAFYREKMRQIVPILCLLIAISTENPGWDPFLTRKVA